MDSRGAAYTLDLARLFSQARASLPRGGWADLCRSKELPFKKRKADMLVRVGEAFGEANAHIYAHLPSSLRALYFLAGLACSLVESLIRKGKIHPGLRWEEAKELLAQYKPQTRKKKSPSQVHRRLARFASFLHATRTQWSEDESEFARTKVVPLLQQILFAPRSALSPANHGNANGQKS